jgi:hypothetical protein
MSDPCPTDPGGASAEIPVERPDATRVREGIVVEQEPRLGAGLTARDLRQGTRILPTPDRARHGLRESAQVEQAGSAWEPAAAGQDQLLILIPTYNDWSALGLLLAELDAVLSAAGLKARILIVDDGSSSGPDRALGRQEFSSLVRLDVLELRRNLGHQRAIAVGLAYVEANESCAAVVVMDSDGEDDPKDVPRLLEKYHQEGGRKIVFAERTQRSESWLFRMFYVFYKLAYAVLTGKEVRFGNFSVIPRSRLTSLVAVSELWNHYAAGIIKSRQPFCTMSTRRGKRLLGQSQMNFVNLVIHGLSAISVESEVVGVRLLVVSLVMIVLAAIGLGVTVAIRLATSLAIPGWATTAAGVLLILLCQAVMLAVVFSFVTLGGRQGSPVLPNRDYIYYIHKLYSLRTSP